MNDGSGSDGGNGHTAFFSTTGPIYPALVEKTCVLPQFQRPSGGKRGEGGLFFEPEPLTMEGSHSLPFQTRLSLLTGILRRLADDFFGELSKALGKGEGDGGLRLHACPPPTHTHFPYNTLPRPHALHSVSAHWGGRGGGHSDRLQPPLRTGSPGRRMDGPQPQQRIAWPEQWRPTVARAQLGKALPLPEHFLPELPGAHRDRCELTPARLSSSTPRLRCGMTAGRCRSTTEGCKAFYRSLYGGEELPAAWAPKDWRRQYVSLQPFLAAWTMFCACVSAWRS